MNIEKNWLNAQIQKEKPIEERFWEKVDKLGQIQGHVQHLGRCWNWLGALTPKGYPNMGIDGKYKGGHRLSWEIHNGQIPDGLCVMHLCDNPRCVNPSHLKLGTQKDNMRDAARKKRMGKCTGEKHRSVTCPESVCRGERFKSAKLTEDAVRQARFLSSQGMRGATIATMFGVSNSVMNKAINGKLWKHVV